MRLLQDDQWGHALYNQKNFNFFFSLCTRLYYKDKNILCRRPIEPLKDEERDNHLFPVADICSWRSLTNHFFNAINHLYLQNRWNILEVTSLGLRREQRVLWKNVHRCCILNYLKKLKTETCRMFFINLFLIYYMYIKKVLLSLLASVQLYYNFFCEVKWYPWPKICIMYFSCKMCKENCSRFHQGCLIKYTFRVIYFVAFTYYVRTFIQFSPIAWNLNIVFFKDNISEAMPFRQNYYCIVEVSKLLHPMLVLKLHSPIVVTKIQELY